MSHPDSTPEPAHEAVPQESLPPPADAPPPVLPAEPPVLAPTPPQPPPSAVEMSPAAPEKRAGPWLIAGSVAAGLALGAAGFATKPVGDVAHPLAFQIGAAVGALVLWPGIILGIFSFWARFRTTRNRLLILLWVWGLMLLTTLANPQRFPKAARPAQAPAPKSAAKIDPPRFDATVPSVAPRLNLSLGASGARPKTRSDEAQFDLSAGSDERMIKLLEGAQEATYHAVVAAYEKECAQRPDDARLALERVRFVARFAQAEDVTIASAEKDYTAAHADLLARFQTAPGTRLYELEQLWGTEFEERAKRWQPETTKWKPADAGRFFALWVSRMKDGDSRRMVFAGSALTLAPTPEVALAFAEELKTAGKVSDAVRVLNHRCFAEASDWERLQRMKLWFDLKQTAEALNDYETLRKKAPHVLTDLGLARRLAAAGRVADGRALLNRLGEAEWRRLAVARERFDFELEFGGQAEAEAAYRALRAAGFQADPLGRERIELLKRFPRAGWGVGEVVALVTFGLVLLLVAAAPLLLLAPIHHWSLWRERRGRPTGGWMTPWRLRAAWAVLGTFLVAEVLAVWCFHADYLRASLGNLRDEAQLVPGIPSVGLGWVMLAVLAVVLLTRARAWSWLGAGAWGWWRSIGLGVGLALILRLVLVVYVRFVPGAQQALAPGVFSAEIGRTLLAAWGPVGLLATVGLFVPVLEETLFRGVLLGGLGRHLPFWTANAVQAGIFAALHGEMHLLVFMAAMGAVAGYLVRRSQSLQTGIALHAANNVMACLAMIAAFRGG